jgi:hypothetical protein
MPTTLFTTLLMAILMPTVLAAPSDQVVVDLLRQSFGLHGCDPLNAPPLDGELFCLSLHSNKAKTGTYGAKLGACLPSPVFQVLLDPDAKLEFFVARGTLAGLSCRLANLLGVPVAVQPDIASLPLRKLHWKGVMRDVTAERLQTEDGTPFTFVVHFENKTMSIARAIDEE